jgi:hypothetical protein
MMRARVLGEGGRPVATYICRCQWADRAGGASDGRGRGVA